MYSRSDDRVCHLGLPIQKKKASKNSNIELQNAKQSFLGGQPVSEILTDHDHDYDYDDSSDSHSTDYPISPMVTRSGIL